MSGHLPPKPKFTPEFNWGSIVGVATLITVLGGGVATMYALLAPVAIARADINKLKESHQEIVAMVTADQIRTDQKISRSQERTERRLDVIHTDVQAIKNMLMSERRRD